jgi:hypothetical protein
MGFVESVSRKICTVTAPLLGLTITVPAQPPHAGIGGWLELGDSHVDGQNDHDKIKVRDHGPFRALRLHVRGSAVEFARARGLFAGISLEGSKLRPDNDANKNLYGKKIEAKDIMFNKAVPSPPSAKTLIETLDKVSPTNKSKS